VRFLDDAVLIGNTNAVSFHRNMAVWPRNYKFNLGWCNISLLSRCRTRCQKFRRRLPRDYSYADFRAVPLSAWSCDICRVDSLSRITRAERHIAVVCRNCWIGRGTPDVILAVGPVTTVILRKVFVGYDLQIRRVPRVRCVDIPRLTHVPANCHPGRAHVVHLLSTPRALKRCHQ
jgi:hypothetical protein